jgi:DNA polymerase I-like protein with 3'-5' exonuclease and polymerase domains
MAKAMIVLHKRFAGTDVSILIQLHDSLTVECPDEKIDWAMREIHTALSIPLAAHGKTFTIPMEFKVGKTWGQLQKVDFHG